MKETFISPLMDENPSISSFYLLTKSIMPSSFANLCFGFTFTFVALLLSTTSCLAFTFTSRQPVVRGNTACFASNSRRHVIASIISGGAAFTISTNASAEEGRTGVEVATKSPIIELFKNFLPNDESGLDSATEIDNSLDSISWDKPKKRGLNPEQMADAINDGLREREWFVTGMGLPELYSDNFSFSDPQVSLVGYEQYCRQVRRLFDQKTARCELICCSVTAPDTITVLWRNSGRVNIGPVGVTLKPYVVTTKLKMDPNDGNLVVSQVDEFASDGAGLLLYQIPILRPLAGAPAPSVDVLRQQCDFYTCKLKS